MQLLSNVFTFLSERDSVCKCMSYLCPIYGRWILPCPTELLQRRREPFFLIAQLKHERYGQIFSIPWPWTHLWSLFTWPFYEEARLDIHSGSQSMEKCIPSEVFCIARVSAPIVPPVYLDHVSCVVSTEEKGGGGGGREDRISKQTPMQ